jgi:acetyl esterase/lipase
VRIAAASLAALFLAATAHAQTQPPRPSFVEIVNKPVVITVPGMEAVTVTENQKYTEVAEERLRMDVYRPPGMAAGEKRPAVLLLHGGVGPSLSPREWGLYKSWGRALAASGLVAVVITHRLGFPKTQVEEGAADVRSALATMDREADRFGIDKNRLCIAAYSAGGPLLAVPILDERPQVRCLVSYYNLLDIHATQPHKASEKPETLDNYSLATLVAKYPRRFPPMMVIRAGKDEIPGLNDSIDLFMAAAVKANVEIDFVNHAEAPHGFDNKAPTPRSVDVVAGSVAFMKRHLQ